MPGKVASEFSNTSQSGLQQCCPDIAEFSRSLDVTVRLLTGGTQVQPYLATRTVYQAWNNRAQCAATFAGSSYQLQIEYMRHNVAT